MNMSDSECYGDLGALDRGDKDVGLLCQSLGLACVSSQHMLQLLDRLLVLALRGCE